MIPHAHLSHRATSTLHLERESWDPENRCDYLRFPSRQGRTKPSRNPAAGKGKYFLGGQSPPGCLQTNAPLAAVLLAAHQPRILMEHGPETFPAREPRGPCRTQRAVDDVHVARLSLRCPEACFDARVSPSLRFSVTSPSLSTTGRTRHPRSELPCAAAVHFASLCFVLAALPFADLQ